MSAIAQSLPAFRQGCWLNQRGRRLGNSNYFCSLRTDVFGSDYCVAFFLWYYNAGNPVCFEGVTQIFRFFSILTNNLQSVQGVIVGFKYGIVILI
jgi:hypothetical protein